MFRVEQRLRERGATRVALGVGRDNARATHLYRRLGYLPWDVAPQIPMVRVELGLDGAILDETPELCDLYVKDLCATTVLAPTP